MDELENFNLKPVHFFALSCDCHRFERVDERSSWKRYLLPSTEALTRESQFAKLALAWSLDGIFAWVEVKEACRSSFFPQLDRGDAVELFFDTRDVKTSGFNTKFCHHFFFLPQAVDGITKGEKTHFRTEERHEWCQFEKLSLQTEIKKTGYVMTLFIPAECLHGYDPTLHRRLGFTYKISRAGKSPQHFSACSEAFSIEEQPSLWSSLQLVEP